MSDGDADPSEEPEDAADETAAEPTEETPDEDAEHEADSRESEATEGADEPAESPDDESADDADPEDDAASEEDAPAEAEESEEAPALDVETFEQRLEDAAGALEDAETEADLDDVEARLDSIESDLEEADLPDPDDEDEDEEPPAERLENELQDLQKTLEDERGPYAEDVAGDVESIASTVEETRWTETGEEEVVETIGTFVSSVNDALDASLDAPDDPDASVLRDAATAIESAGLGPDEDADTIQALVEATATLEAGVEEAESWDDLSVREQLQAEGYYDALGGKFKDYPPEWSALKEWEKRDNAEMVLLILEKMGQSDFMERHALDALKRMGNEESLDEMKERAQKRDIPAIEVVGKIGSEDGIEAIREYTDSDSNPELQKTAIKALGEIGSHEVTQDIANELDAENDGVRSQAARALGLLGDTRAIDPLADLLGDDEEPENVRASAAWALVQIGTERALEEAAEYADERSYIVQNEARTASEHLDDEPKPTA